MTRAEIVAYSIASLILAASIIHSVKRSKRKPRLTVEAEQDRLRNQVASRPSRSWVGAEPVDEADWEHGQDHDYLIAAVEALNESKKKTA